MTISILLIGILIAMGIFASLGWSVLRAVQLHGRRRAIHIAQAVLILAGMAMISIESQPVAMGVGVLLLITGHWAAITEDGWSKALPLIGAAFGAALLLGLPFSG